MESNAGAPGALSPLNLPLRYAKCNNPPTQIDYQLASQYVENIDKDLKELQIEIDSLESQLTRLQDRVKVFKHTRKGFLPMLSPWRRLPTDILAEIMQTAVNPEFGSLRLLSPDFQSTDRTHFKNLRSVCRSWREVAFVTPSLWTSVWVNFDEYPRENVHSVIRGIGKYFERSGSCLPLGLGFRWKRWDSGRDGLSQRNQPLNRLFTDIWLAYLFSQRSRLSKISFFTTTHFFAIFEKQLKRWSLAGQTWKTERLYANLDLSMGTWDFRRQLRHAAENSGVILGSFPDLNFAAVTAATEQALDLDLLKTGHSGLPALELIGMSHDMDSIFAGLGAFTHLNELYLSVPPPSSYFEEDVSPLSHHAPSFEFPRLQLLVINDLLECFVLSKLRAPALELFRVISNIPSKWRLAKRHKRLRSSFPYLIDFIRGAEELSTFHLNGWFVQDDQSLLSLFQALYRVKRVCIDTWFHEENPEQYNDSVLSNMIQLCIHLPDEDTPDLPSSSSSPPSELSLATSVPRNARTSSGDSCPTASYMLPFCRQPLYWKSSLSAYLKARSSAMEDTLGGGEQFGLHVVLPQFAMEGSVGGKDVRDTLEIIQRLPGINVVLMESCRVFL
jgi:hypothetical protein